MWCKEKLEADTENYVSIIRTHAITPKFAHKLLIKLPKRNKAHRVTYSIIGIRY